MNEKVNTASVLLRNDWNEDVKKALNEFIALYANTGSYVVFDFDNSSSIFDTEEHLMAYQLVSMAFAIVPEKMRDVLLKDLTAPDEDLSGLGYCRGTCRELAEDISTAYEKLWAKYGPFTAEGLPESVQQTLHEDLQWQEFSAKMRVMYTIVCAREEKAMACTWLLYWHTDMSEEQVYQLSVQTHRKYGFTETAAVTWKSPEEIKSLVGPVSYTDMLGIAVTENIRELWKALYENGIDIWVCSASCTGVVRAAIDVFGLHPYCKGMLAMTLQQDEMGIFLPAYDFENGCGFFCNADGTWTVMDRPQKVQPQGIGKVKVIENIIMPLYENRGPVAGFMDSVGDFNFCTEFASLKLVVCFNRANRKVTDGGGLIAVLAMYQKEALGYTLRSANANGDILYVLQGRDENGMRTLRPGPATLRACAKEEKLFAEKDNYALLDYLKKHCLTTEEILNTFALATKAEDSQTGFAYGFLEKYRGYRSR